MKAEIYLFTIVYLLSDNKFTYVTSYREFSGCIVYFCNLYRQPGTCRDERVAMRVSNQWAEYPGQFH
jgi:hypothetical protein